MTHKIARVTRVGRSMPVPSHDHRITPRSENRGVAAWDVCRVFFGFTALVGFVVSCIAMIASSNPDASEALRHEFAMIGGVTMVVSIVLATIAMRKNP